MDTSATRDRLAKAKTTAAYADALEAPDPRPPRSTLVVLLVGAVSGLALVGVGLATEQSSLGVIGGTLAALALILFVMTAPERARAALPVQRELAEIVAVTRVPRTMPREIGPFESTRSAAVLVEFVELRFEDGTAARREVRDAALRQTIRAGTLAMPALGVADSRAEELHRWTPLPDA